MAGQTTPGSHAALRDAAGDLRKVVCNQLGRQAGVVDKWMLPPPIDAASRDANGIPNPLDHLIAIHHIVASDSPDRADDLIDWLCRQLGGRFTRPAPGQRELVADASEAAEALAHLYDELKRRRDRRRPGRIAALRRTLQNYLDLTGEDDQCQK